MLDFVNVVDKDQRMHDTRQVCHLCINHYAAQLFVSIFLHLKMEMIMQFPASNNEKYDDV